MTMVFPLPDAEWEPWGTWTSCTSDCGISTHSRSRTCGLSGPGGNPECEYGSSTAIEDCAGIPPCDGPVGMRKCSTYYLSNEDLLQNSICICFFSDGNWGLWSEWSSCQPECGPTGSKNRTRECLPPQNAGKAICPNQNSWVETGSCANDICLTSQ